MAQYSEEWYYPTGQLATNQRAIVFGPGDDNVVAPIFSDPAMTVPLANPTTTDANGMLTFYAADGTYWIWVGPTTGGNGIEITLGASPDDPVLSVNGIAPDGAGNVALTAADIGAPPITRAINTANGLTGGGDLSADRTIEPVYGTSANTIAEGDDSRITGAQQRSTLTTLGDIYVATGPGTVTRFGVGADGQVLISDSGEPTGLNWDTLTAADVGADPAGSALAASRHSIVFTDDRNVLTVGAGDARYYNRENATLTIIGAWVSAGVVPTGADIIVDVNINGTTIYSTQANRPTVPAGTNGGGLSATPDTTSFAVGDYLTVDIDQIGSTIAGGRMTVGIIVQRSS